MTFSCLAFSQSIQLSGKVKDNKGIGLEAVTVSLHKVADSSLAQAVITLKDGSFSFIGLKPGNYYAEASFIGYSKAKSRNIMLEQNKSLEVPDLILLEKEKNLKEITVVAQKPFIERFADKTVVNVESSLVSSGSTALEVLQRTPGITVDKDDHVLMNGKSGVSLMLDGKLTYLSADQMATLLKNMPSENISKIEVITNPSSKYDAAGTSGILNIITKKGKKMGMNGNIRVTGSHGISNSYGLGFNINYKTSIFNFFGDFTFDNHRNIFDRYNNSLFSQNPLSYDAITSTNLNHNQVFNYKAGVDIQAGKMTSLNLTLTGYNGHFVQKVNGSSLTVNQNPGKADTTNVLIGYLADLYSNISIASNITHKLDTLGQEISMDANYSNFYDPTINNQTNAPFEGNPPVSGGNSIALNNHQPSNISIYSDKIDYTKPFDSTAKLEMGGKISYVRNENKYIYDSLVNGVLARPTRLNYFIYTERILAAYISGSYNVKKLKIQLGLRLENTSSDGNLISESLNNKKNYTNVFPNISLTEKFDQNHSLGLSITRRIDRPDYGNINPFVYYIDKTSSFRGNPDILPQFTYQYEISYTYKQKYIASLRYSHLIHDIEEFAIVLPSSLTTEYTIVNFNGIQSYSASLNIPIEFTSWWSSTNNISGNYNQYSIQFIQKGGANSNLNFNGNIIETFKIPRDIKAELNFFYNSPGFSGTYHYDPQYAIGAGIQKTFLNKHADIKFNVNDIFNTNHFYGYAKYNNVDITIRNNWESRRFNLNFTYRFGNASAANHKENAGSEEAKRAGAKN